MTARVCAIALGATLLAAIAAAQSTTGRLIGRVADEEGAPVHGATVTIQSPALLGGLRVGATEVNGEFGFRGLNPGEYRVRVEGSGFIGREVVGIKVPLGGAATVFVELPRSSFAGEIEVIDETPVIDPTRTATQQILTEDHLQSTTIGLDGRNYLGVLEQTPGAVGAFGGPKVFGSTRGDNAYIMDGMDTTDPADAAWGMNVNFDAISEIQFLTGGFAAEHGRATGGIVNLVTKSGGNQFSGLLDIRYRNNDMQTSGEHSDPSTEKRSFLRASGTLGGPILRDNLWFFVALSAVDVEHTPTGSPTAYSWNGAYPLAKLSWQTKPHWRTIAKYSGAPTEIGNANASQFVAPEATRSSAWNTDIYSVELAGVLSESTFWNTTIGAYRSHWDVGPENGDRSRIAHLVNTGQVHNSYHAQTSSSSDRNELAADLTWFVGGVAGSHEFKAGIEAARTEFRYSGCFTGTEDGMFCTPGVMGRYFEELAGGIPFRMITDDPPGFTTDRGRIGAGFLQDAWRIGRHLTLRIGARYDRATFDNDVGERVADLSMWQPRLGVAWDVTGDATSIVRANFGRYMHPSSLSTPSFARVRNRTVMVWLSCSTFGLISSPEDCRAIADWYGIAWTADPENFDPAGWVLPSENVFSALPNRISSDLVATYADTLILSYERQVGLRTSLELSFVEKSTRDIFEDTCAGNWPEPSEDADCSYFVMANLPELKRDYRGLVLKLETRTLDWLTLLASYTYSTSRGSVEYTLNAGDDFDHWPAHYDNRYGFLSDHARHRVKLNGFFNLESDWTIAFDYHYSSPSRWQPVAVSSDSGGSWNGQEIPDMPYGAWYAEPRGSREASALQQLDLQVSKGFTVQRTRLVLIGSIVNVLDFEAGIDVCGAISGCATVDGEFFELGGTISWQTPTSFEIGLRVEF